MGVFKNFIEDCIDSSFNLSPELRRDKEKKEKGGTRVVLGAVLGILAFICASFLFGPLVGIVAGIVVGILSGFAKN